MPMPVSVTATSARSGPWARTSTTTRPPGSVNLPALMSRLPTIWVTRAGSAQIHTGPSGAVKARRTSLASKLSRWSSTERHTSWRAWRPITAWARQLCSLPGVPWSSTYMPLSMAARGLRSSWDRMARNSFLRRSAAFRAASLSRSSPSAWRRSADSRRSRALVFSSSAVRCSTSFSRVCCWSLSSASVSTRATTLPNRLPSVSRISRSSLENGSDPPCPTMATAVIRRSRGSGRKASEQAGSARVWVPRKPVSSTARISPPASRSTSPGGMPQVNAWTSRSSPSWPGRTISTISHWKKRSSVSASSAQGSCRSVRLPRYCVARSMTVSRSEAVGWFMVGSSSIYPMA